MSEDDKNFYGGLFGLIGLFTFTGSIGYLANPAIGFLLAGSVLMFVGYVINFGMPKKFLKWWGKNHND